MNIAVTGASGHLGRVLVPFLWERGHVVVKVGRIVPDTIGVDAIVHLAAPDWRDEAAVEGFAAFNAEVLRWSQATGARVVSVGSWWQYATGDAPGLAYSRMKAEQQGMFPVTVVPFSVYGHEARAGRGFVPHLLDHARGSVRLSGASREQRDWVHARDVCEALRAALTAPDGVYEAASLVTYSPAELVRAITGETVPEWVDVPSCAPRHVHPQVPGWAARVDVLGHLRRSLGAAA